MYPYCAFDPGLFGYLPDSEPEKFASDERLDRILAVTSALVVILSYSILYMVS